LIALGSIIFFILLFLFLIRRYIRKSVDRMKEQAGIKSARVSSARSVSPPIKAGPVRQNKAQANAGANNLVINMRDTTGNKANSKTNKVNN
jgi:hypothetical protein